MREMLRDLFRHLRLYLGIMLGFGFLSYLSFTGGVPIMMAPLAASACIIFAVPGSAFARPKSLILGHALSAAIGVICGQCLGVDWLSNTICVGLSVAMMDVTDTMHPPAAATSLLALTTDQGYRFIFTPVALGSCVLVLAAELVKFSLKDRTSD